MYEAEQTVSDSSEELHCSYQMTIIVLALKKTPCIRESAFIT